MVANDKTTFSGGWRLYNLYIDPTDTFNRSWILYRVQTYDVRSYWNYADWYSTKYNAQSPVTYTVTTENDIPDLSLKNNVAVNSKYFGVSLKHFRFDKGYTYTPYHYSDYLYFKFALIYLFCYVFKFF